MSKLDLVEVALPDGTTVKSDPSGDEAAAGTFAQDAHGRELARGANVEVLAGEDAGAHGRVQDVSGQYVTVTFPDGSALRTSGTNVRTMSAVLGPVACPYCDRPSTLDGFQRLGAHRNVGGVCDGSGRVVERQDTRGRAVFAYTPASNPEADSYARINRALRLQRPSRNDERAYWSQRIEKAYRDGAITDSERYELRKLIVQ